ncbi:hypothetical protein GA0074692_6711 [Micromonospora pallida]|uniref:Uncharacterized protein n=1 Tax=Micromonospora pallida TaxID=145854 RepID=A0A1C6TKD7_9ACTN|nr:hypothetical protein [Micromonospora pallida]SCL42209.1 hypothetical protein GA0074692_6711 [Micromonospora pallida]
MGHAFTYARPSKLSPASPLRSYQRTPNSADATLLAFAALKRFRRKAWTLSMLVPAAFVECLIFASMRQL